MEIATLLVDTNDVYSYDGILPMRSTWDKELLKAFIKCNTISVNAVSILPPSLAKVAKVTGKEPTMALKVKEIDALADIIIVTRVPKRSGYKGGERFRFDKFEPVVKTDTLEIWRRKD